MDNTKKKVKVVVKKVVEDQDITKEMFIDEFTKGQKKYANDNRAHKFDHMDLQTFMWNMYEENIKTIRRRQKMWTTEVMMKYLKDN